MDIKNSLEEATTYLNNLRSQLQDAEAQVEQMKQAEQQVIGRITLLQELQEEEKPAAKAKPEKA